MAVSICIAVEVLPVTIVPSPPLPGNGEYQVGSSLNLACQIHGGHSPFTFTWNSTCSGLCFVVGETTDSIGKNPLHSIDSGNHTCSVTDYTGRSGDAGVQINLSGQH